jgi:hypothetical protein
VPAIPKNTPRLPVKCQSEVEALAMLAEAGIRWSINIGGSAAEAGKAAAESSSRW